MRYDDFLATLPPEAWAPPQGDAEVPQLIWTIRQQQEWRKQQPAAKPPAQVPDSAGTPETPETPETPLRERVQTTAGGGMDASPGGGVSAPLIKSDSNEKGGAAARSKPASAESLDPGSEPAGVSASASRMRRRRKIANPTPSAVHGAGSGAAIESPTAQKWGALKEGFATFPNLIIRNQVRLGLDCVDLALLLHLASYWFTPENHPWPSKEKLAAAIGRDVSTVRKRIKAMEDKGFVRRIYRFTEAGDSDSNKYDLSGLVAAAEKMLGKATPL